MNAGRGRAVYGVIVLGLALMGCGRGDVPGGRGPFDVLITDARIVDGAGNPWVRGDVGLRGDRIAAVGDLSGQPSARTIDAADRVVSPGFIDMMGQSSVVLVSDPPSAESKLRQGITTYLSGEGGSAAPQSDATQPEGPVVNGEELRWRTYAEYFAHVERIGIPINVVHDVGLTQVRRVVLGEEDVQPTPEQLEEMKALVRQAMEDGAVGTSTSLIYPPAVYATTEELVELTRVAGEYGGTYFTHMRNESHSVLEAIREAIEIGVRAGTPVHIYHLKAAGQENWPLMAEALALIDSARVAGDRRDGGHLSLHPQRDRPRLLPPSTALRGRHGALPGNPGRPRGAGRPPRRGGDDIGHRTGRTGTATWGWTGTKSSSSRPPAKWTRA